ncbi:hypothetical protein BMW23_0618 [Bodo saltans virus]|uniref:Uncharacterized protein n=1 Tax=Bodo saltans virus TaxID=2024608 RepID=A0A2H4UUX4_9VIRU|nr:hypothetical protein QJ851_gp0601 [Bodo saltans virus]ATZ80664.1 hypothetical protein BMW23_0618 [Bodo saltans virus]
MLLSSSDSILSPMSMYSTVSSLPISPVFVRKYTANVLYPSYVSAIVDSEHNDNPFTQKQMVKYLLYRILDKWIYTEDMSDLFKFLKISSGKVEIVKSENEYNNNDISKDNDTTAQQKVDYIEKEYLSEEQMRQILIKIINELGYKWYNLTRYEKTIVESVYRYLKSQFKKNWNR